MPVRGGPVLGIGVIEAILGVDNSRLDNRSAEKAENKHEALVGRSEVRSTRVLDPARVPGGLGSCELRSDQALLVPSRPEIPSSTATNEFGDEDALRSWGSQPHMPTRPPSLNAGLLTWARSYGVRSNQEVPPGLLPATSPAPTDVCAPLPLA